MGQNRFQQLRDKIKDVQLRPPLHYVQAYEEKGAGEHSLHLLPTLASSPCHFQRWVDRSSDVAVNTPFSLIVEGTCGTPIPTIHAAPRAAVPSAHPLSRPWVPGYRLAAI